jgi:hypothetical protein
MSNRPKVAPWLRGGMLGWLLAPAAVFGQPKADLVTLPVREGVTQTYLLITVNGGRPAESRPCDPLAAHGFFGKEAETVEAVKNWIRGRTFATQTR